MALRKTLTGIILSAYLAVTSPLAFSQQRQEYKLRFSLKPHCSMKESSYFLFLQKQMRGRDYIIVKASGDNMPIIVPNMSKYNMPIIKPGPEWYGDDKFVIKPKPEWNWPQGFYKLPPGILLYQWKRK